MILNKLTITGLILIFIFYLSCAPVTKAPEKILILDKQLYGVQPDKIIISDADEIFKIVPVGGDIRLEDRRLPEPITLIRIDTKEFQAFSGNCPDKKGAVRFHKQGKRLYCSDDKNLFFNLRGKGPGNYSLKVYPIKLEENAKVKIIIYKDLKSLSQ